MRLRAFLFSVLFQSFSLKACFIKRKEFLGLPLCFVILSEAKYLFYHKK